MEEKSSGRVVCDDRLKHIAFIMDGNGRWAKSRGLSRSAGHRAGAKTFRRIVDYVKLIGAKYMTVYAFSTENWSRPAEEVSSIMKLLEDYIEQALGDVADNDVRVIFLGDRAPLSDKLRRKMDSLERRSEKNSHILNIALNYGGRDEIVRAVKQVLEKGLELTGETIAANLYTKESPPPDLIVRTAGELRLSNFLLWQSAYSELYFTDKLWPDFTEKDVDEAVAEFYRRTRRFGGI